MSSKWPRLLSGSDEETSFVLHVHDAEDITGVFTNIVVSGNIRSLHWNGGGDLSAGRDTVATEGYLLDAVSGRAQFKTVYADGGELKTLTVTGILDLNATGYIRTSSAGQRVEITGASVDRVTFYGGDAAAGASYIAGGVDGSGVPQLAILAMPTVAYPVQSFITVQPAAAGPYGPITLGGMVIIGGTTTVGGDIIPSSDLTRDLGTADLSFDKAYIRDIYSEAGIIAVDTSTFGEFSYTPAWSSSGVAPALGNGTSVGYYIRQNNLVEIWGTITLGNTSTVGSGNYLFSIPVTASGAIPLGQSIGAGRVWDSSGSDSYLVAVGLNTTSTIYLVWDQQTAHGTVGAASPVVPATSDYYTFHAVYPAA